MKHARNDYMSIQDSSGKIPDDEPVFLLRAKDKLAPLIIRTYADLTTAVGAKADFTALCKLWADQMEKYANEHYDGGKVPDADPATFVTTPGPAVTYHCTCGTNKDEWNPRCLLHPEKDSFLALLETEAAKKPIPDLTKPPGCICKDVVYMNEKCTAHPDLLKDETMHKDLQGRSPTQAELEKLGGKSPDPSPAKPKAR